MEEFYKRLRKRSENKPFVMAVLMAVFYFCMGVGFTGIQYEENVTIIISCLLCIYMTSLVFVIVKGSLLKAAANCAVPFVLGAVIKFIMLRDGLINSFDMAVAFGIFFVMFVLGLGLGKLRYGRFMDKS